MGINPPAIHTELLRYDDRSDSGLSSLRGSTAGSISDERSGSRSSALSSCTDESSVITNSLPNHRAVSPSENVRVWRDPNLLQEPEPSVRHIDSVQHHTLLMSHPSLSVSTASGVTSNAASTNSSNTNLATAPRTTPDSLATKSDTHSPTVPGVISSVASLQHLYPPGPTPAPFLLSPMHPANAAALAAAAASGHQLGLGPEALWKRYPPLPPHVAAAAAAHLMVQPPTTPLSDDLIGRQRERIAAAYAQDRDRHERMIRRDQEARELEKVEHYKEKEERERLINRERERHEKREMEQREMEKLAVSLERERIDRERKEERERKEQQWTAEQAVHKHFEESLRLANQKRGADKNATTWNLNLIKTGVPGRISEDEQRKVAQQEREREMHRQIATANDRLRHETAREARSYYVPSQSGQRPPSVPSKSEYPPPAHSSRPPNANYVLNSSKQPSDNKLANHSRSLTPNQSNASMPKAEPNFGIFSGYHPTAFMVHSNPDMTKMKPEHKLAHNNKQETLGGPPPLMSEVKNSVIVKHDTNIKHMSSHSPKMAGAPSHYPSGHKPGIYEYRSPSQSPHVQTPSPHTLSHEKSYNSHHLRPSSASSGSHQQLSSPIHQQRHSPAAGGPQPPSTSGNMHHGVHPSLHVSVASDSRYSGGRSLSNNEHHYQHPSTTQSPYSKTSTSNATYLSTPYMSNQTGVITTGGAHYALPSGISVTACPKPTKSNVPSTTPPFPSGIAPNRNSSHSDIQGASNKHPATGSPYQQIPHYRPTGSSINTPPNQQRLWGGPPPAHAHNNAKTSSIMSAGFDPRSYDRLPYGASANSNGANGLKSISPHPHGASPPTAQQAPLTHNMMPMRHLPPPGLGVPPSLSIQPHVPYALNPATVQTQPLDLGAKSSNDTRDSDSPKRKLPTVHPPNGSPIALDVKKRRVDDDGADSNASSVQQMSEQPIALVQMPKEVAQPDVMNSSDLPASSLKDAKVVNLAMDTDNSTGDVSTVPITQNSTPTTNEIDSNSTPTVATVPAATEEMIPRPSSNGSTASLQSIVSNSNSTSIAPAGTLSPSASPAPVASLPPTPNKANGSTTPTVDSDKSNSPGAIKSHNPGYTHLKKAWLKRHTGKEDIALFGNPPTTAANQPSSSTTTTAAKSTNKSSNSYLTSTSFNNIGSMAVNSINKSPNKGFANKEKTTKKTAKPVKPVVELNGHDAKNDSSSSDQESTKDTQEKASSRKPSPKRKTPKNKRKKGATAGKKPAITEEKNNKKPRRNSAIIASDSGSDSEKETGVSDSDSSASTATTNSSKTTTYTGKKTAGGGTTTAGGGGKEPRKRGRRPKSSKNDRDEPRNKKSRDSPPRPPAPSRDPPTPTRDPFRKPSVAQLKKTGESFLQDGPCFEVAPKLAKCRECRWTPNQRSKNMPNIFCRFYAFRRLRYTKNGQLAIAGFSDPFKDPLADDLKLWLPSSPPSDLDTTMSVFLLRTLGDQCCNLIHQEKQAQDEHMSDNKQIAWKRVVQGVREMCDVCETTLFNYHWACGKCGFVVCIDCYKSRKTASSANSKWRDSSNKDRDEYLWLLCTNRQSHEQEKLMLTQIIAGDSMTELAVNLHKARRLFELPQDCDCETAHEMSKFLNDEWSQTHIRKVIQNIDLQANNKENVKVETTATSAVKQEKDAKGVLQTNGNGTTDKFDEKKDTVKKEATNDSSSSAAETDDSDDSDDDNKTSTLRELLVRPTSNKTKTSPKTNDKTASAAYPLADIMGENERKLLQKRGMELKYYSRRFAMFDEKGRLPIRIWNYAESHEMYPDVPHSWLCDGKLLRLTDVTNPNNAKLFSDQWRRGQPVIVSDCTKRLDKDLWTPDSFSKDFGDEKNDLINCLNSGVIANQPMRKFWEGFENISRRLKDDDGSQMLLKLKDWPPGEDFAELLPSRYADLIKVLPLPEYTHRSGHKNLASRLPDCFVRPDLGPKMYNAYGSAMYPSVGTTNLHLDVSDAVNVLVYVGIPKDGAGHDEYVKEVSRAIDEARCDLSTRRRVREKGELPGALWHIYHARDADKIRDLLNKVAFERGVRGDSEVHHDPIHDQSYYLDGPLRDRLYKEYNVEGYAIVQCLGDAVFIPAGAPHQVRNLHNCIKVAEDFVSPENVSQCFHLTQEFRTLSDTHTNHEDKLQIKNIVYHAIKDSISVMLSAMRTSMSAMSKDNKDEQFKSINKIWDEKIGVVASGSGVGSGNGNAANKASSRRSSASSDANTSVSSPASNDGETKADL